MSTAPPAGASPAHVIEVGIESFESQVILRSRQVPVLVDFWAAWCGPCKTLGPVLERLAGEMNGRFVLAKVDIDKNPELADLFQVQSVPSVLLLKDGRLADGFLGALPEKEIRRFLDAHLSPAPKAVLDEVRELEAAGQRPEAIQRLRAHLRGEPADGAARLALARILVAEGKPEEARLVFEKLAQADKDGAEGRALAAQLEFSRQRGGLSDLEAKVRADPADLDAAIAYGKALVAAGRGEEGLAALWRTAETDVTHGGGAPRKALIEVFGLLGYEHPLVVEYQRRLSHLLCS